ncbi:MAG: hypothetical protein IPN39_11665 [Chitinophagaceae bacterium]|nr:hypothetical protein [Chitinophagaceae bacterium]
MAIYSVGKTNKGKNSDSLQEQKDMGGDGWQQTTYGRVSRDVYGLSSGISVMIIHL